MRRKKAFTLLELVVSLAIISILVFIISSMLTVNFKISNKIYKADKNYKEAVNAMLYIENIVREADKIEQIDDNTCNFRADLRGSKYKFIMGDDNKLKVEIKGKNGTGTNWIGLVNDIMLYYNGQDEVFLWLEGLDGKIYQTRINIGIRQ
ncbi:MAG: PulJ/GspJ family protein [Anaerococcus sp.]